MQPPKAKRRPRRYTAHGVEILDDYAWIRAENWREAIQDHTSLPTEIRALLEAENAYADSVLADVRPLAEKIYEEMEGRVDETDCDPPARDGDWLYYRRYRAEGEHELVCRKAAAGGDDEQILLDGDILAEDKDYFSLGDAIHSPDHKLLAYGFDDRGNELHHIVWRDLDSGAEGADVVGRSDGTIVWTADSRAFLYARMDQDFRSSEVYLHRLGADPATDRLVFAERDPAWFVHLRASRSRRAAIVKVSDHDCSECWLIDLEDPEQPARLVQPRQPGLRYDVEPGVDRLYVRTNADDADDYKLVSIALDTLSASSCREEVPHRPGRMIFNATVFKDFLVWLEREDCRPRLIVKACGGGEHALHFEAPCHHLRLQPSFDFGQPILRFAYSSLTEPAETYDYDMAKREKLLVKRQKVPSGHDPAAYESRLEFAAAPDGEQIPISMVWRRGRRPGPGPLLLYGYGAYGVALPDSFDEARFSLIDRGFVYAIAHVRGGTEKGSRWYEAGKLAHKTNTFTDYLACARHLCETGATEPGKIVAEGGSAGGMLMGAVANLAPNLFGGMIAEVPFVDVLNTICDASLPLTPPEWREWGNPIEDAEAFRRLLSYSPYDNVTAQAYPPMLIEAGLSDPRVTYWEPAKWAQALRAKMTGGGPILLKTNMEAGHGGAAGRYEELEEAALRQAFAVAVVGDGA